MRDIVIAGLAFAGGYVVAKALAAGREESCCRRVAAAVREEVTDAAGPAGGFVGAVGDALGLWDHAPGLLDLFGVK